MTSVVAASRPHYPHRKARLADLVIHLAGLTFAIIGGGVIIALTISNRIGVLAAIIIYVIGLLAMLSFSTAYNFGADRHRALFRRLDHAGIFLMIAGSYTPFTTSVLSGTWAWTMTLVIWTCALCGVAAKLFRPDIREWLSNTLYLAMGWVVVLAAGPIVRGLSPTALALLVLGGLIYSVGVIFHIKEELAFSRSIWHGHVVAGAGAHWAAILIGTVLVGS